MNDFVEEFILDTYNIKLRYIIFKWFNYFFFNNLNKNWVVMQFEYTMSIHKDTIKDDLASWGPKLKKPVF